MKKAKIIFLFLIAWFLVHESLIIIDGLNDDKPKGEIAIVFGNKVNEDGTLSPRLKSRLDKALELYNDSLISFLFVSGGLGKEGFYEGNKMKEYLVSRGVNENRIVVDNEGNTTMLTAKNFKAVYPEIESVTLVSQFYHISRAKLAFRKMGVKEVSGVSADYFEWRDFYSLFREFFGYYKYLEVY